MMTAAAGRPSDVAATPTLGIVKTTYPRIDARAEAANEADYTGAAELDAWARRVFAANGFGEADVLPDDAARDARPGAVVTDPPRATFPAICAAVGRAIADAFARAATGWHQYRELRLTYDALAGLDERTLKDIGLGSHEAASIAAELAGRTERTRVQAERTLRELTI